MTNSELKEKLGRIAGEAYGKGTDADDVAEALAAVKQRFDQLAEVDA